MENNITYAYIETTNHCNLNCSFCNRQEVVDRLQHMSVNDFEILLTKIKDQPIREVKLMGMGEPFYHPMFFEICRLFKETFPNAKIISATNCQYVISKNFKESLKYIDELYFSIDGYKETYEKYRGGAKWSNLIRFLDDFKTVERHNCKVVINYVINPNNVSDIQLVYDEILLKYDLKELRLNFAQNWSENENMVLDYSDEQINYIKTNWKDNVKGKSIWDYNDCFWVKEGLYVTVEGDLKMCCINTNTKSFGNIFKTPVNEIRLSDRYINVKNGCTNNKPTDHCKNCS